MATIAEMFSLALQYHQSGNLSQAEGLYRQILQADPGHADSHHLLGVIGYQTGHFEAAVQSIRQAVSLNPWATVYYSNLGLCHDALGRLDEAVACFEQQLRVQPDSAEAHNALGNTLQSLGRVQEAEHHCRQAIMLRPNYPAPYNNLGNALLRQGRRDEAAAAYEQALWLQANFPEAHNNLGMARAQQGRPDDAVAHLREAVRLNPSYVEAHHNLGNVLRGQAKAEEAIASYREVLRLQPNHVAARSNLARLFLEQQALDAARAELQRLDPTGAVTICLDYLEGLLFTSHTGAYGRGLALAQELFPDNAVLEAAALFRCHSEEVLSPSELSHRQVAWAETFYPPVPPLPPRTRTAGDRVRIAYVGTYLHPVFLEGVLRCHDYDRFDIWLITDSPVGDFPRAMPRLRICPLTGTDIVRFCREQALDLAIDMVGAPAFRDGLAQFALFQQRLAPIQANWIVTPGTTGSRAFDYVITDAQLLDPAEDPLFTEHPARLPEVSFCWKPPERAPDPGPPPARRNGYVTFGSTNRGFKITTAQLRVWAEVLARCPDSRLALIPFDHRDREFLERVQRVLDTRHIARERVLTRPFARAPEHLNFYRDIDISLDTYPYNGHITTLDSLWMGVPVVSRYGRTMLSRCSRCILVHLGCSDWLAASEADYIRCACELAGDLDRLGEVRTAARSWLAQSLICDPGRFTRHLEALFLAMLADGGKGPVAVPSTG